MASSAQFLKHPFELIASLWDSPPTQKLLPPPVVTGEGAASAAQAALEAAASPANQFAGVCGYVPGELAGTGDWYCKLGGQVVPSVVFFISILVFAGSAAFLVRYASRCRRAIAELQAVVQSLQGIAAAPAGRWAREDTAAKVVQVLLAAGDQLPPMRDLGLRVRESMVPMQGEVALRQSMAASSDSSRRLNEWTGRELAEALPGWLTAIGLLTTFIAILIGLQSVKVLSNMEVRGIGGLVNGLSGKFFSSIVALGCAIGITVTHHFLAGRLARVWLELMERLDELLPHLSVERVFIEVMRAKVPEREIP